MFTNFLKKRLQNVFLNRQIQGQFSKQQQQKTQLNNKTVESTQQQTIKLNEPAQSQIKQEKIINSRNDIPAFTKQVRGNIEDDQLAYTNSIQMNMLRRLHVRSQFQELPAHERNEYFLKRMSILNTIFPFFHKFFFSFTNDNKPDDDELVYDIEKINLKEYVKKIIFQPGSIAEEDLFPKLMITGYVFVLLSWFMIDVVIFKVFYSKDEILGNDSSKKYINTQLKGMEYKMELKEQNTKFPQLQQQQDVKLDSILYEVQKQAIKQDSKTDNNNNKKIN